MRFINLRSSAGLLAVPLALALAGFALLSPDTEWRFEWGRALNMAGLYLFISSPLYAGLAAFDTVRQRRQLRALAEGLPDWRLADQVPWLGTAVLGLAVHLTVMAVIAVAAWQSDAVGSPYVSTMIIQAMSIAGFAALGGLVGSLSFSYLVPPALTLACIGLNVLVPTGPFRNIVSVGTGQVDLLGLRPDPRHELVQSIVFGLVVVAALPIRRIRARARLVTMSAIPAVAVLVAFVGASSPVLLRPVAYDKVCAEVKGFDICGPEALRQDFSTIATALVPGAQVLRDSGVAVPVAYEALPPGHVPPPSRLMMVVTPQVLRDPPQLQAVARAALVGGQVCDIGKIEPPDETVIIGRALLDGWLQESLGQVIEGTYPSALVNRLRAMPQQERSALITQLYGEINACSQRAAAMDTLLR